MVSGFRYQPRQSDKNGIVMDYRIQYSVTGLDGSWSMAKEGTWSSSTAWKLAQFDTPVLAKYIRLYGVTTSDNNGNVLNQYMSAAEVRVRYTAKELNSSNTVTRQ